MTTAAAYARKSTAENGVADEAGMKVEALRPRARTRGRS